MPLRVYFCIRPMKSLLLVLYKAYSIILYYYIICIVLGLLYNIVYKYISIVYKNISLLSIRPTKSLLFGLLRVHC